MAELSVSRRTISALFLQTKKFVIPEFQRPYSWDVEKCDTLWTDIINFHSDSLADDTAEYFLGTIVSYRDGESLSVIDGQQRITSFLLLLRAFFQKLEDMKSNNPPDEEVDGLMSQIAPCIWDVNAMSKRIIDKKLIHIESLVVTEKDNDAFRHIMIYGKPKDGDDSNYSKNYDYFVRKCNEYAMNYPLDWKQLCLCILNQCIILPIECNDVDSALTIFSTLNDRGLELSDSDIFKAELYKTFTTKEDKKAFIEKWKELTETVSKVSISIDDVFRYYTHILRGKANDKTKEIALRKYYSKDKFGLFKDPALIDEIVDLAKFWESILSSIDDDNNEICNKESRKLIHCLLCYPNDFWRYPLSVFYYFCKGRGVEIKDILPSFLKKLVSFLFVRFIEYPTVNSIKDFVYQFCIELASKGTADFSYVFDVEKFRHAFTDSSNTKISRPIILLNSYLYDADSNIIPLSFDIEHIFPQKWDDHYFKWTNEEAEQYINQYGNKIPLEKKLNIKAANGFYNSKKQKYTESRITEIDYLLHKDDWGPDDIRQRTEEIADRVIEFFADNIMSAKVEEIKLIVYKGGTCIYTINKVVMNGSVSYTLLQEENGQSTQSRFSTYDEAFGSIPEGMIKFGTCEYRDESLS